MNTDPPVLYGKVKIETRLRAAIIKLMGRFVARADANTAETYLGLCSPAMAFGMEYRLPSPQAGVKQGTPPRVEALVLSAIDVAVQGYWEYIRTDMAPPMLETLVARIEDWAENGWGSYKIVPFGVFFRLEKTK
jgi:hypothetical protein